MVGARGIEPLTSSTSRKRSPTELRAYKTDKIIFSNVRCQYRYVKISCEKEMILWCYPVQVFYSLNIIHTNLTYIMINIENEKLLLG